MSYYNRGNSYGNFNQQSQWNSKNYNDGSPASKRKRTGGRRVNTGPGASNGAMFKEPVTPPPRSPGAGSSRHSYRPRGPYDRRNDYPEPSSEASWYWDNYFKTVQSWQEKHQLAYYRSRCLALEFENQMLFEQIHSLIEDNCVFAAERGEMPSMKLPELFGEQTQTQDSTGAKSAPAANKKSTAKKQEQARKQEGESNKLKKANEEAEKSEGPKQPKVVKVEENLELLYGENSKVIHKLETALQLNFNKVCDTHQPELWMAAPLNPETYAE